VRLPLPLDRHPHFANPAWETARQLAQEAAEELGLALGVGSAAPGADPHSPLDPVARFRAHVTAAEAMLAAPALVPLSTEALAETRATLESIARLEVKAVIPGHGAVFGEVDRALERAFYRLDGYEEDPLRLARHCAKAMIVFALLEKRRMPLAALPRYVAEVGLLRELNARHLRMAPKALAEWLVTDLERVRAIRREEGDIVPLPRA